MLATFCDVEEKGFVMNFCGQLAHAMPANLYLYRDPDDVRWAAPLSVRLGLRHARR